MGDFGEVATHYSHLLIWEEDSVKQKVWRGERVGQGGMIRTKWHGSDGARSVNLSEVIKLDHFGMSATPKLLWEFVKISLLLCGATLWRVRCVISLLYCSVICGVSERLSFLSLSTELFC